MKPIYIWDDGEEVLVNFMNWNTVPQNPTLYVNLKDVDDVVSEIKNVRLLDFDNFDETLQWILCNYKGKGRRNVYTIFADFETWEVSENEREICLVCYTDIDGNYHVTTDVNDFLKYLDNVGKNITIFFHNAMYDVSYLLPFFKDVSNVTLHNRKFYEGIFYRKNKAGYVYQITARDSLKLIPMSIKNLGSSLKTGDKGVLNIPLKKCVWTPTIEQINYVKSDVKILKTSIENLIDVGLDVSKKTTSSNAYSSFTKMKCDEFDLTPLPITFENDFRSAYKGGFTYVNPIHIGKIIENVASFDVNSMYPYCMTLNMPYGDPLIDDVKSGYDYHFYRVYLVAKLKPRKIPIVSVGKRYPNEIEVTRWFDMHDLERVKLNYDIEMLDAQKICSFKSSNKIFSNYVKHHYQNKVDGKLEGNMSKTLFAKLMLNGLYGKFGEKRQGLLSSFIRDDFHRPVTQQSPEVGVGKFLPLASAITANARHVLHQFYDVIPYENFIYTDTDSVKCVVDESLLRKMRKLIDPTKIGKWSLEGKNLKIKVLGPKCYATLDGEKLDFTVAGLPKNPPLWWGDNPYPLKSFEKFEVGLILKNVKLRPKWVKGGIDLVMCDYKINPR
jgi:hypothetical protein